MCLNKLVYHITPRQLPFTSFQMKLWLIILACSTKEAKTLTKSLKTTRKWRTQVWPFRMSGANICQLSSGIIQQTNTLRIIVQANRLRIVTEANTLRIKHRLTRPRLLWRQTHSRLLWRLNTLRVIVQANTLRFMKDANTIRILKKANTLRNMRRLTCSRLL